MGEWRSTTATRVTRDRTPTTAPTATTFPPGRSISSVMLDAMQQTPVRTDERNLQQRSTPQVRAHIDDGAHEKSACGATFCHDTALGSPPGGNEVFSACNEVLQHRQRSINTSPRIRDRSGAITASLARCDPQDLP